MKVCILADVQSAHTKKWARSIAASGHEVIIISFRSGHVSGLTCHTLKTPKLMGISPTTPFLGRFHYLFSKNEAQKIIDEFDPDIVHAFWATSYGFLGARLKTKRYFLSVWGMDITDSPRNPIMKQIVRYSLKKSERIFCTSNYLLEQTRPLTSDNKKLVHIPFGIDIERFAPANRLLREKIVIGSTKSFEAKYGIMNLVKAFEMVSKKYKDIELLLIGSGSMKGEVQTYVNKSHCHRSVTLLDAVDIDEIPGLINQMDIYVMPSVSNSETFGVAALEASACGIPVIGSNIGGIPEVIEHEITGLLVPPDDIEALVSALDRLIDSRNLRDVMGKAGRTFVKKNYLWENNVHELISYYNQ